MSTQVYCGNLNYDAKRQDVSGFFEEAGFAVTHVNMTIDRETGRNKSFAFVEFPTESDASNAIAQLDGREFMGREIKVKPAERRAQDSAPRFGQSQSGWRSGGVGNGGYPNQGQSQQQGQQQSPRSFSSDNWRSRSAATTGGAVDGGANAESQSSVYLGGIPNITSNDDAEAFVKEVLQSQGLAPKSVSRMFRPNSEQASRHPNGGTLYCFVEMDTVEDANSAMIKLDNLEIEGGARLRCNVSRGPGSYPKRTSDRPPRQGYGQSPVQSQGQPRGFA